MKKFSKLFESNYFNEEDIGNINDILNDIDWDGDEVINIENYNSPNGIDKFEIYITIKKNSYSLDIFKHVQEYTDDILNVISHLREFGKVYHRMELIQTNRYFGGDFSEIYFQTKITIKA
jgi:hypothetical protein